MALRHCGTPVAVVSELGEGSSISVHETRSSSSGFAEAFEPRAETGTNTSRSAVTFSEASSALETLDENFFANLRDNPRCADCDQIFAKIREKFITTTDPVQLKRLALAMAQSERPELVLDLIERFRMSENQPSVRAELIVALELVTGGAEVSRVLAPLAVPNENEDLRDAAVTGLTGLSDLVAVEALVRYARALGDGKGGYHQAMGLGESSVDDDVVPFVQSIAADGSAESPLAIRALFNSGLEPTKRAVEVLLANGNEAEQRRLLNGAESHVLLEPMTLEYLRTLLSTSDKLSPTVREFFNEVLARDPSGEYG